MRANGFIYDGQVCRWVHGSFRRVGFLDLYGLADLVPCLGSAARILRNSSGPGFLFLLAIELEPPSCPLVAVGPGTLACLGGWRLSSLSVGLPVLRSFSLDD